MAFAFAQRSAELKAKPPWVEPASYADQVRAALVCAADASQGPVSVLEIIRPAPSARRTMHSRAVCLTAGGGRRISQRSIRIGQDRPGSTSTIPATVPETVPV
jgi:hypothetical protein